MNPTKKAKKYTSIKCTSTEKTHNSLELNKDSLKDEWLSPIPSTCTRTEPKIKAPSWSRKTQYTLHVTKEHCPSNQLFSLYSSLFGRFVLYCFTSAVSSTPSKSRTYEPVESRFDIVGRLTINTDGLPLNTNYCFKFLVSSHTSCSCTLRIKQVSTQRNCPGLHFRVIRDLQ